jgi:peptide/nickel transport system substrate-binding protein
LLAGCGDEGAARFSSSEDLRPGGGGALTLTIPPPGGFLDPLRAQNPAAQMLSRQIFEPLVSSQKPPYEGARPSRGLAVDWVHSRDYRVWAFNLRSGVEFQDGEPFNAAAVAANAGRWIADPAGAALLPGLIAADDPRPGLVRFIFSSPVRDLPRLLGDPRLGIISPLALKTSEGGSVASLSGGTGAFRLAEGEGGVGEADIVLRRYGAWWGGAEGLGPALDELIFRVIVDPGVRLRLLGDGLVRIAVALAPGQTAAVRADPLLAVSGAPDGILAFQRSVHGLGSGVAQPLSGVWIALVQTGAASL